MVKLRTGPGTCHIKSSLGPDVNKLQFYCTQYSTKYCIENYHPRIGRHSGTGYSSNFRPQLYYSRSQDQLDNPVLGFLLTDNYETVTRRNFRPAQDSSGCDILPTIIPGGRDSGFIRQRPITVPLSCEAGKSFFDTRKYGGNSIPGIAPRHKPALHFLKKRDPTERENYRQGPRYMSTETSAKFKGDPTAALDIQHKDVSCLEETGFTHNKQIEPITFTEDEYYGPNPPNIYAQHPTENSVTKTSFKKWRDVDGGHPLPDIRSRSSHETGFIRQKSRLLYAHRRPIDAYYQEKDAPKLVDDRIRKNDPSEYLNMKHPHNRRSVTIATYEGKQKQDLTESALTKREIVGAQELTGHSLNNGRYDEIKNSDETLYLTDYNSRFHNKELQGVDREGWVMGGLHQPRQNGYTRDFKVHSHGKTLDTSEKIQRLKPYVARSIKGEDRFFDDYTHLSKVHAMSATDYRKAYSTGTLTVKG